jgi:hypothetical protein
VGILTVMARTRRWKDLVCFGLYGCFGRRFGLVDQASVGVIDMSTP